VWVVVTVSDVDSAGVVVVSMAVDVVMSVEYTGKTNMYRTTNCLNCYDLQYLYESIKSHLLRTLQ